MAPLVLFINGFTKGDWTEALLFALSVAVGLTPEMLPMIVTSTLAKYIIGPRLWAGFISLPVLAMIFSVVGIWGGRSGVGWPAGRLGILSRAGALAESSA